MNLIQYRRRGDGGLQGFLKNVFMDIYGRIAHEFYRIRGDGGEVEKVESVVPFDNLRYIRNLLLS